MQLETRRDPDVMVITPLEARVDALVAPAFRNALLERIGQGHRNLLVNMECVEFIDSSGWEAMASAVKRLGSDGHLKICSLSADVRSMFELTRLNCVIVIAD